jgi:sulfopyruvate decarboxylase subunit alpha
MIDRLVAEALHASAVELVVSLPCAILSGVLDEVDRLHIRRIPVCREEEGVGIAAGAALAGKRVALIMQNSGLGNCINALASLTGFYQLPLFLLMSHRGGPGEPIAAQIPMGRAAPGLLDVLSIEHLQVATTTDIELLEVFIRRTYEASAIGSAFLSPELWHAQR